MSHPFFRTRQSLFPLRNIHTDLRGKERIDFVFLILHPKEKSCDFVLLVLLADEEPGKRFCHRTQGSIPL